MSVGTAGSSTRYQLSIYYCIWFEWVFYNQSGWYRRTYSSCPFIWGKSFLYIYKKTETSINL